MRVFPALPHISLKFLLPGSGCASSTILLIPCYPGPHFHILHPQWPFINPQDSSNGFRSAMAANRHGAALGVSTPCSLGNTRRAPTRFNERYSTVDSHIRFANSFPSNGLPCCHACTAHFYVIVSPSAPDTPPPAPKNVYFDSNGGSEAPPIIIQFEYTEDVYQRGRTYYPTPVLRRPDP